jgi:lysozyme family protein
VIARTDRSSSPQQPCALVRRVLETPLFVQAAVADIYLHDYWFAGRCDRMPWPVSLAQFDACVNTGVVQAAKFQQRTVATRDDGLIGSLTLEALTSALERDSLGALAVRLARQRIAFHRELARSDPEQRVFLSGWLNRVEVLVGTVS